MVCQALRAGFTLFFFLFAGSSIFYWDVAGSWLGQQRVFQLLMIFWGCLSFLLLQKRISSPYAGLFFVVCLLGVCSSVASVYPEWALQEWARVVGMGLVVFLVAHLYVEERWQMLFVYVVFCISFILAYQFLLYYFSAIWSARHAINPYVLYAGFDNPRFYSQVMVLFMPLLAYLGGKWLVEKRWRLFFLLTCVAMIQWCVLVALAGRGSWLAILISHALFVFLLRDRAIVGLQFLFFCLGLFLYGMLFFVIPEFFSLPSQLPSGMRYGLSAREVLWKAAFEMFLENPFLGVGPLHFSAVWNHIAAHPHQMILQWLAEWGGVATSIALFVIGAGLWRGLIFLAIDEKRTPLDSALWLALVSALILAQVDGVFVMPYTEGWLVILAGLALARWLKSGRYISGLLLLSGMRAIACAVLVVLGTVISIQLPQIKSMQLAFWEEHGIGSPPRLWDQGWIPMRHLE